MNSYNLRSGLVRMQLQLRHMTDFVNEALREMPKEFEFQAIGPCNTLSIRERTPNDAVEKLRSLLNTEFLEYPNGWYKIVLEGETVDGLDYMRL